MVMDTLLNLLILLKDKPTTTLQLMESRGFEHTHELLGVLRMAQNAGLVVLDRIDKGEWNEELHRRPVFRWFSITELGKKVLNHHHRRGIIKTKEKGRVIVREVGGGVNVSYIKKRKVKLAYFGSYCNNCSALLSHIFFSDRAVIECLRAKCNRDINVHAKGIVDR